MKGGHHPSLADSSGIIDFRPAVQIATGLILRRFAPCALLRPYVQYFWQSWGRASSDAAGVELLHPDGPKRRTVRLAVGEIFGMRFLSGMALPFVGEALSELTSTELVAGDTLRRFELGVLQERLLEAPELAEQIALMEHYLLARLRQADRALIALRSSLGWLQRRHAQASIAALVDARKIYQRAGFELVEEEPYHSFGKDRID